MPTKPGAGSLSGLQTLVELAKATRDMAAARGFVNLVERFHVAIDNAERAPSLDPGDPNRTQAFTRLASLQRDASRAFARNRDTEPPKGI